MESLKKTSKKSSASPELKYRLGMYVRLSPSDELREEGSLVSHPQRIKGFVEYKNTQEPYWGEIVETYTDADYSGKDTNRPGFKRMLQDIKYGHINAVVVTELSRISRDVKDFCNFWEFLKLYNATFISLKENFDTSTPIGEMMVIQAISFAQFERKTIVTRIKDGARARAERGLVNGGCRILGLDLHPTKKGHLVVNEKEAVVVRHIFEKYLELGALSKVRDYLNENGYRTKKYTTKTGKLVGGEPWSRATVANLLANVKLIGKVEVNRDNKELDQDKLPDSDKYKLVDAVWSPIVDLNVFNQVQTKLEINQTYQKHHKHLYRLSGMLECGLCGRELSGQAANGRNGKYFYYGHSRKYHFNGRHKVRCDLERLSAVRIEEAVINRLIELAKSKQVLMELVKESQTGTESLTQEMDQLIAGKEQEKRKLDSMIDNLIATLAEMPRNMKPKAIIDNIAKYEKQRDQIADALEQLRRDRSQKSNIINVKQVFRLFGVFKKNFGSRPAHEQRDLLRDIVKKVVIQKDGLQVVYFSGPDDEDSLEISPKDIEEKLLGEKLNQCEHLTESLAASGHKKTPGTLRSGVRLVSKVGVFSLEWGVLIS